MHGLQYGRVVKGVVGTGLLTSGVGAVMGKVSEDLTSATGILDILGIAVSC